MAGVDENDVCAVLNTFTVIVPPAGICAQVAKDAPFVMLYWNERLVTAEVFVSVRVIGWMTTARGTEAVEMPQLSAKVYCA